MSSSTTPPAATGSSGTPSRHERRPSVTKLLSRAKSIFKSDKTKRQSDPNVTAQSTSGSAKGFVIAFHTQPTYIHSSTASGPRPSARPLRLPRDRDSSIICNPTDFTILSFR